MHNDELVTEQKELIMRLSVLLLISCITVWPLSAQNTNQHSSDEQKIRALEEELLIAYYKGDVEAMSRIEADDFTVASEKGERTKQEQLEGVRKRQFPDVHEAFEARKWSVRFFGPVAVVEEVGDNYSIESRKNSDRTPIISTAIWAKRGDEWKAEHMQYSELKPEVK